MTEVFDDKTAFLEALHGKKGRARRSAPKTPQNGAGRATAALQSERSERTGLSTLIKAGWNVEWDGVMRIRLWRGTLDTGFCADERAACVLVRYLGREPREFGLESAVGQAVTT